MKKTSGFLLKAVFTFLAVAVMLFILALFVVQLPFVQRMAADYAAGYLSERTGAEFSVGNVSIGFINGIGIEDVRILDRRGDTMIVVKKLDAAFKGMNPDGVLRLGKVRLTGAGLYVKRETDSTINIIDVFGRLKKTDAKKFTIKVQADRLIVDSTSLVFRDFLSAVSEPGRFGKGLIDIGGLNIDIAHIDIGEKSAKADIRNISLAERHSGLVLHGLKVENVSYDTVWTGFDRAEIHLGTSSLVLGPAGISYDSIRAIGRGKIRAEIMPSTSIAMETVDRFLARPTGIPVSASLSGSISGRLSDFSGKLMISSCGNSIDAGFTVKGMPDIKNTLFDLKLEKLRTDQNSLSQILPKISGKAAVPGIVASLGEISLTGSFKGDFDTFDADAALTTGCGTISATGKVFPTDSTLGMDGSIDIPEFNLGRALGSNKTGNVSVSGRMSASRALDGTLSAIADLQLSSLEYGGYTFHDITVDGRMENRKFIGCIYCDNDPNLLFRADGTYGFTKDSLPHYDFDMKLRNADLAAIGLNRRDSVSILRGTVHAQFSGNDIDNINGMITVDSSYYINQVDTLMMGTVTLEATNSSEEKFAEFRSRFADADFSGRNSYRNLIPYFKELTKTYIPSFEDVNKIVASYDKGLKSHSKATAERIYDDGYYRFRLTAKETNRILSILVPGMEIAKGSSLDFYFNPGRNRFDLKVKSEAMIKGKMLVEALKLESHNNEDSLFLSCSADMINLGKFHMANAGVKSFLHDNRIGVKAYFGDTADMADIRLDARIGSDRRIHARILPSAFRIDTSQWSITNRELVIDSAGISIDSLLIRNGAQRIYASGKAGKTMEDSLVLHIDRLDLSPATFFIKDAGYNISALANGHVEMVSALKEKVIKGRLTISDILFTGEDLGSCILNSTYDKEMKRLMLSLSLDDGTVPVTGFYSLGDRVLDLQTAFPSLRLSLLAPILKGSLIEMGGTADSRVHFRLVKGKIPFLDGKATINRFITTVAFTKGRYTVDGEIDVKDNLITMNNGIVHDMDGNTATLNGYFYSADFRKLEYSMDITSDRILGLNTGKKDNDYFFGKVYGSGLFHIDGTERRTTMSADMATSWGSTYNMPFSSVANIEQNKFITFRDESDSPKQTEGERLRKRFYSKMSRAKYSSEMDISLKIKATPDVLCNIEYTNSVVSNLISGTGNGDIFIHVNPKKEIFTMEGGLDIDQGTYRLIFYIADKTFQLKKGSRIWWTGDPTNPQVDFTGIYQVHTSLEPLLRSSGYSGGGSSVAIDCGIHMGESFFSPNISFDITAPSATPETQNILRNALNTQEALSTQFFSLFLTNSFTEQSGNNTMGNIGTSLVSTTGFEFLSSQISSLLSTDNFSWRPTYKPRTETSSDEFGVQTKVNLMQNKITLNFEGRYYVNPQYNNRKSPFSGGGDISINLNPSGNLKLKAFTRVIDRFDETQGLQESGMGVYFTQEFDSWKDLKRRIGKYWERKQEKREQRRMFRESLTRQRDSIDTAIADTVALPQAVSAVSVADTTSAPVAAKPEEQKMVIFATDIKD